MIRSSNVNDLFIKNREMSVLSINYKNIAFLDLKKSEIFCNAQFSLNAIYLSLHKK